MSTSIKIVNNAHSSVYCFEDVDLSDPYADKSSFTSNDIQGFQIVSNTEYFDFQVRYLPKEETIYYLVFVNYDSGDSFGTYAGQLEYIDLYRTEEEALEAVRNIHSHYLESGGDWDGDKELFVTMSCGKKMKISPSWLGYFEKLNDIEVKPIKIVEVLEDTPNSWTVDVIRN